MRVYQIRGESLTAYINRMAGSGEEALMLTVEVGRETRFRKKDLHAYGITEDEIEEMLESGFLKEIDVGRKEALRIAGYHKFRTDPGYRRLILGNLKKAQENYIPESLKGAREKILKKRKTRVKRRRTDLLNNLLIPNFGNRDGDGNQLPPEEVSIVGVLKKLEEYPRILKQYPGNVYAGVFRDIKSLGIKTAYVGETIKRAWKKKLREEKGLLNKLRDRIQNATETRIRLYKEDPERARIGWEASAKTRREKMQNDPEFRSAILESLAKGNPAFRKKG